MFQFYRSDGAVHVHVWICETVQPSPILKSANAVLNIRDYPGIHTQVSIDQKHHHNDDGHEGHYGQGVEHYHHRHLHGHNHDQ